MKRLIICAAAVCFFSLYSWSQNVVLIIIDGGRYTETCGAGMLYMPHLWKDLRPLGALWTNFYNDSITVTDPAHSSITTGTWQQTDNAGLFRPTMPTLFEYFRKATGAPETGAALIVGKHKLDCISFSTHPEYGATYTANVFVEENDSAVAARAKIIFAQQHPNITVLNFPDTDGGGHSGIWKTYVDAIQRVDSLIYGLWQALQADPVYKNTTTMFITNDHGRHDRHHGGFRNHGDGCEGCRHIMLFAIGRNIPAYEVLPGHRNQCDITPTVGELLRIPTPYSTGTSLLQDFKKPVQE